MRSGVAAGADSYMVKPVAVKLFLCEVEIYRERPSDRVSACVGSPAPARSR